MAEIKSIQIGSTTYDLRDDTKVVKNTAITAGTKCKITYDAKGLVTGGANLEASDIPSLGAGKITSGTFDTARIPSLAASKITSGTFDTARIPSLAADKINSGTFDIARIPTGTGASQVALGNHTHSITLASDSGTPAITLSHNTTYKLTAGGSAVIFKLPSDSNTNYYHTPAYSSGLKIGTGTGVNDMYVPNGSTTTAGVLQIGTGATNAAAGNHSHTVFNGLRINTQTDTTPLVIARSGDSGTNEIVKYNVNDSVHNIYYINDETSSVIKWTLVNTDTEGSTGVNASTHTMQVSASKTSVSLTLDGTAVSMAGHTHNYAGSSSAGGAATSAAKLTNTSKIGDTNKPVYFTANGVPAAISYTIEKSVPSNASFTDTITTVSATTSVSCPNGALEVTVGTITTYPQVKGWDEKQAVLPTTTTAGKVLKSTSTAGTVVWGDDSNTNTWRNIKVDGTEKLGTGTGTGALNFVSQNTNNGDITFTYDNGIKAKAKFPTLAAVATSGSYNDLSNKPTIPATNVIPTTTTGDKLLVSTTTSGTAKWSNWSSAGFIKTNASGVVSIDTTAYVTDVSETTAVSCPNGAFEVDKNGSSSYVQVKGWNEKQDTLPTIATAGKVLKSTSTAGTVVWGDDNNTNYYHTPSYSSGLKIATGTGVNDLYVPTATTTTQGLMSAADKTKLNSLYVIPTTTTAGKVLKSTSTSGTVEWGNAGGGSTLYRHNIEFVWKTGSSPDYEYAHFFCYTINASSTAYTSSTFLSNLTTLFKKMPLCGGYYDAGDLNGIEAQWVPTFNKNGVINGVGINFRYSGEFDTYWAGPWSSTSGMYSFTDTVETLS